jgi:Ran GTPase-activating protein (RanGAP) involved in mRNA processing and transport
VQWLNLYMNDIGDQGAERIADALKRNKSISTIDLGGNNISAKGTSDIASALKENSTITTLEFSYNPIGPAGAKVLAETLKFHGNVQTLRLGWCQVHLYSLAHCISVFILVDCPCHPVTTVFYLGCSPCISD